MIASPTTQSPTGPRARAVWAQARLEAARPSKRERLSEFLVLLLAAGLVGTAILFALNTGQAAFRSYTRGAMNVSLSALVQTPRLYEGHRVHVRGQAGTIYATDNQYRFVLTEPGAPSAGGGPAQQIMVVTSTAADVAGGTTVDVWGVVTTATAPGTTSPATSGATAQAGDLPVLTLDARYVRDAP
jgi:hypothetical protein